MERADTNLKQLKGVHQIEHGIHGLGGGKFVHQQVKEKRKPRSWNCNICPRSCVPEWCPSITCPSITCPSCACPSITCPSCACPACPTWCTTCPPKCCTECPPKCWTECWFCPQCVIQCWEMCNISELFRKCYTCECLGPVLKCECDCMANCAQCCSEKLCSCPCYSYLFRCLDYVCTCQCIIDMIRNRCGINWLYRKCCPCCIPPPPEDPTKRIDNSEVKFTAKASEMFNRMPSKNDRAIPVQSIPEMASEPSEILDKTKKNSIAASTSFVYTESDITSSHEEKTTEMNKEKKKKKKKRVVTGI